MSYKNHTKFGIKCVLNVTKRVCWMGCTWTMLRKLEHSRTLSVDWGGGRNWTEGRNRQMSRKAVLSTFFSFTVIREMMDNSLISTMCMMHFLWLMIVNERTAGHMTQRTITVKLLTSCCCSTRYCDVLIVRTGPVIVTISPPIMTTLRKIGFTTITSDTTQPDRSSAS